LLCPQVAVVVVVDKVSAGGWVMVAVAVAVHPLASFTVIVYVPADNPVAVAEVPPEGVHA
jgi:hypothetical protein